MQSAGGLVTTLEDMARWLAVHINDGRIDGTQVLPADAVAESHKLLAQTSGTHRGLQQLGYGLGWQVSLMDTHTLLMHGGGFPGFSTHMSFMPDHRIGVAAFANNGDLGSLLVDAAAREVYNALLAKPALSADSLASVQNEVARQRSAIEADLAQRAARPQTLPLPRDAYTGTFENPIMGRLEIATNAGGTLEARMGAAYSAVEVYDARRHQLRVELFGSGMVMAMRVTGLRADSLVLDGVVYRRK